MSELPMNELRHRAINAVRTRSVLEDSVRRIQEEISKLQKELDGVQEEFKRADVAAVEPVEEYAKASCQALCRDVQEKLPREVRDMVWYYISTRDKVLVSEDETHKLPSYFKMKFEVVPGGKEPIAHYWDPDFVGKPTFNELTENYYRTSCFHFEGQVLAIKMFLNDDTWGLGFRPGTMITKLAFYFSPRDICGKERQLKLAQIWSLFNLKYGCSIKIVVRSDAHVPHWYSGQSFRDVKQLFEDIFPVLCSLKKAGYGVKIAWNSLEPTYLRRNLVFVSGRQLMSGSPVREIMVERTVKADDREHSLMRWLELCEQGK